jgi:hypothetical protein
MKDLTSRPINLYRAKNLFLIVIILHLRENVMVKRKNCYLKFPVKYMKINGWRCYTGNKEFSTRINFRRYETGFLKVEIIFFRTKI